MKGRAILVTRFHLLLLGVIAALTITAFLRVPQVDLPMHWGLDGNPDMTWPRTPALLAMPVAGALSTMVLFAAGWLSPREQVEHGRSVLETALAGILLVFAAVQAHLLLIGIGSDIDILRLVAGGAAAVLVFLGLELPRAKPYARFGIRLPWWQGSESAWRAAHRLCAASFLLAGAALAACAWLAPEPRTLIPALLAAVLAPCLLAAAVSLLVGRGRAAT